jgi:hypothetical protein
MCRQQGIYSLMKGRHNMQILVFLAVIFLAWADHPREPRLRSPRLVGYEEASRHLDPSR